MPRLLTDLALAAMNIWIEARGEPFAGKIGVACVMRNRMHRKWSYSGDLVDTVMAPYQFSGWNTTDPNRREAMRLDDHDPVVMECIRAWELSDDSSSEEVKLFAEAVFYFNPDSARRPAWAVSDRFVTKVGRHEFYRA